MLTLPLNAEKKKKKNGRNRGKLHFTHTRHSLMLNILQYLATIKKRKLTDTQIISKTSLKGKFFFLGKKKVTTLTEWTYSGPNVACNGR